jgi:hypothetical protein
MAKPHLVDRWGLVIYEEFFINREPRQTLSPSRLAA